jgi:membrane protein
MAKQILSKVIHFVTMDIWRLRLSNYSPTKSFLINQLRIIVLAVRGFAEDKCKFRASALTFFSLLSIVPVIALTFGIAKGLGGYDWVEAEITQWFQGQEEVGEKIIAFSNSMLEQLKSSKGGLVAGIGTVLLFWTVIRLFSNIESSFNDIWGVKRPRHIGRKFSDYLSMMLVCPALLVLSSSMTVMISDQIRDVVEKIPVFSSAIAPLIFFVLKFSRYVTIWLAFTFMLMFMPNTRVKFKSGILAGVVSGTLFQIVLLLYINFQIGVAKYGAVYGSFASLPLFLIWLQISWLIVLFGAELAFAHQNVDTYEFEQDSLNISHSHKRLLSLMTAQMIIKSFCDGNGPLTAAGISHELDMPIRLVRQILFELLGAGILSEVKRDDTRDVFYQPGRGVDDMTIKFVTDALENRGSSNIPVCNTKESTRIKESLEKFGEAIGSSDANIALKDA